MCFPKSHKTDEILETYFPLPPNLSDVQFWVSDLNVDNEEKSESTNHLPTSWKSNQIDLMRGKLWSTNLQFTNISQIYFSPFLEIKDG